MTARRLSQFLALSLAALTWWVLVSRPGVIETEFALEIHAVFAAIVAIVFGLAFVALRVAKGGNATYWTPNATHQVHRILWMVLATLGVMLVAAVVFNRLGWAGQGQPRPRSAISSPGRSYRQRSCSSG